MNLLDGSSDGSVGEKEDEIVILSSMLTYWKYGMELMANKANDIKRPIKDRTTLYEPS